MDEHSGFRVAVIGAGIGGLAFAAAVSRLGVNKNIELHIFEAAPQLGEIGAGITIWPRTYEVLKLLGCQEILEKYAWTTNRSSIPNLGFRFRKSDQKDGFTFFHFKIPGGSYTLHRADLQKALLQEIGQDTHMHLSSRVVSCKDTQDFVTIRTQDGKEANFDLVIGADGIKSAIRKEVLTAKFPTQNIKDLTDPVLSGSMAYRGLIPREVLQKILPNHSAITTPTIYCGRLKHIVTYPISNGRLVNVVAFFSDYEKEGTPVSEDPVQEVSQAEALLKFEGWEDEVIALFKSIDRPSRWAIQTSKPIAAYAFGRIALLGDAAHAMTPHLGSGAGQAIEDAYILALILVKGIQEGIEIERIMDVYNTIRQPMGNYVLTSSRRQGFLFDLVHPEFQNMKEHDPIEMAQLTRLAEQINRGWNWNWQTSVGDDQRRALAML